ncbi:MAG: hypothetical protein ACYCYO_15845 [Bacilli bacterium]
MVESDKPVLFRKIAAGEFSSRLLGGAQRHESLFRSLFIAAKGIYRWM